MDQVRFVVDLFLHLDKHLNALAGTMGGWLYGLLFLIVFCETGLVVTPFLPGDSLLFAVGALAASPDSPIRVGWCWLLLVVAAILGDAVNYSIGARVGAAVFTREDSRWLNKDHLRKAHAFYEKYGGKAIVLARFAPIIRTFVPFVAGVGTMSYPRFAVYNVTGAVAWVSIFLFGGYKFGGLPVVKRNFHFVILAIIVLSVIPIVVEFVRGYAEEAAKSRAAGAKASEAESGKPAVREERVP